MVSILEKARASLPEPTKTSSKSSATTAKPPASKPQADSSPAASSTASSGENVSKKTKPITKSSDTKVKEKRSTHEFLIFLVCKGGLLPNCKMGSHLFEQIGERLSQPQAFAHLKFHSYEKAILLVNVNRRTQSLVVERDSLNDHFGVCLKTPIVVKFLNLSFSGCNGIYSVCSVAKSK